MARLTPSPSSSPFLFSLLLMVVVGVRGDCPCTWYEISRAWYCGTASVVPTDCWPMYERISRVVFEGPISQVSEGDFIHENLFTLTYLELQGVGSMENRALTNLTNLVYLDLSYGQLTVLPDLGKMTHLLDLEAEGNHLTTVPDLTHMTLLKNLHLNDNDIQTLPDSLLPSSSYALDVNFQSNSFAIINACSLITASEGSYLAFDDLEAVKATQEESDILKTKNFKSNIDLEGIIVITDDPTDP